MRTVTFKYQRSLSHPFVQYIIVLIFSFILSAFLGFFGYYLLAISTFLVFLMLIIGALLRGHHKPPIIILNDNNLTIQVSPSIKKVIEKKYLESVEKFDNLFCIIVNEEYPNKVDLIGSIQGALVHPDEYEEQHKDEYTEEDFKKYRNDYKRLQRVFFFDHIDSYSNCYEVIKEVNKWM